MSVNKRELAICKRRGHEPRLDDRWRQCKWCGLWLRAVTTVEEREDEPPRDQQSPLQDLHRMTEEIRKDKKDKRK